MKLKMKDLRPKKKEELLKQLEDLKQELANIRVSRVHSTANKLSKLSIIRKNIARVLTAMSQNTRENLRKFYAGHKYKPLDLRPKKTRSLRRALTPKERSIVTHKQDVLRSRYPKRRYAIKC